MTLLTFSLYCFSTLPLILGAPLAVSGNDLPVDVQDRAVRAPVTTTWHGKVYTITGPTTLYWEAPATTIPGTTITHRVPHIVPIVTTIPARVETWYSVGTVSDSEVPAPTPVSA